ncbi:MAG: hypothetical protein JWM41_2909 [Gemmatimonadetes bacterium]|nr:hypothetical protein [Gemmatimonadota bacterium]
MASSLTANLVLDLARGRSPHLQTVTVPDGVLLQMVQTRQRTLLLQFGGAVDGLVSTSVSIAAVINGTLVGVSNRTPVFGTTYQDGYATHQTPSGTPYWLFTELPIAGDPFGQHGGVPGFPLPNDFLKLVKATCVDTQNVVRPLDVIAEVSRLERTRLGVATAFVSGNRLVPVRPLATGNATDAWTAVVAVQLSYVALPTLASLTDPLVLPAPLTEALIAGLAEQLAAFVPRLAGAEQQRVSQAARAAEQGLSDLSVDVVGAASSPRVQYRG